MPWRDVALIVTTLAATLVAQFAAVCWFRFGVRSVSDVRRQAHAERLVEQETAEAERAAAGRDEGEAG
jgi:hypothetical protein